MLIIILAGIFLLFDFIPDNKEELKNEVIPNTIVKTESLIVDSDLSYDEALSGIDIPGNIKDNLVLIDVEYFSFDEKLHKGQIIIHKELKKDLKEIFDIIKEKKFPVEKVIPISEYNWSDEASMEDNNTSAFNYRKIKGVNKLSAHAMGRAIDINPELNPQFKREKVFPAGAEYNPEIAGTITKDSFLYEEFKKRGWAWGGSWRSTKDYQHFEKLK